MPAFTTDHATSSRIPGVFQATRPERLRRHAQDAGDRLPAELEGSEHAFAELVD
ncbi:TPA: hypothetical protein U2L31_006543 [Burkholderia contaminans]|nr:hypothetical protein [Burkholderia contaminans]